MADRAVPALAALAAVAFLSGDEDLSYAGLKRRLRESAREEPMDTAITTVLTAAVLFFVAERDENPRVSTLADALEFTSTAMSVGYSNFFPETEAGKLIASALMTAGPSITAGFLDPPASADDPSPRGTARERARRPLEATSAGENVEQVELPATLPSATDRLLAEKLDAILDELRAQRRGATESQETLLYFPPVVLPTSLRFPRRQCSPTCSPRLPSCQR
jgi:hypothetical protein